MAGIAHKPHGCELRSTVMRMQVTTVHRKQVFLAPGQQGFSPNLSNGALRGAPPFALY